MTLLATTPTSGERKHADWPIFILSSQRSGSTLLRYLLDAHERLACPPESKFIAGLQPFLDYPQAIDGIRSMGISSVDLFVELRFFVERLMRRYTRSVGKPRWVDKTPNYYQHTHLIERIFANQVLYLILVRHPLDTIASLESFQAQTPNSDDPEIARAVAMHGRGRYSWAQYWRDVYSRLDVFAASCQERCLVVRYEWLVREPHKHLKAILNFVGEEYDSDLPARAFSMQHAKGFGDNKILRTTKIHDESIDRWLRWRREEAETLWGVVGQTATRYGYGLNAFGQDANDSETPEGCRNDQTTDAIPVVTAHKALSS